MPRASAALLCAALACAACKRGRDGLQAPAAAPAQPPAPAPGSSPQKSDVACLAPLDRPDARVSLRAPTGTLRLGVLAGLKDADDANVLHLRKLVAELRARGAEALLADGDLGDNPDEQETLLSVLTETGLPVLAAAGNRELRGELDAAEAELRKKGARIVDLSHARIVDLGDLWIVGLPGAFDRRQLHAEGACLYVQKDLDALAALLDKPSAGPPVLLAAAVPPRGQDARALDVSEGQNVGDARLSPLLTARRAPFGVFGQVWESGGRAIDAQGAPVAQGAASATLYLNPGAADRSEWPMEGGAAVPGQAALLTISGRRASYEMVRLATEGVR